MGLNSLEKKESVTASCLEHYQALLLRTEKGVIDINLEPKDLPWLKELVSKAQKIISFYEKEATQP